MAQLTIESVVWDSPPDQPKVIQVAYRKTDDLDIESNYVIVSTNTLVDVDGTFFVPVIITGLSAEIGYTVRTITTCGGLVTFAEFNNQSDAAFSLGYSLGFKS